MEHPGVQILLRVISKRKHTEELGFNFWHIHSAVECKVAVSASQGAFIYLFKRNSVVITLLLIVWVLLESMKCNSLPLCKVVCVQQQKNTFRVVSVLGKVSVLQFTSVVKGKYAFP